MLHYSIFRKKHRKLWSFKMLRYSIHCQALNFFDMIISERLCAIREIRDVEIDEGQPSMKNLKEFTQAFSTAACYYQAKNLSIWHWQTTSFFIVYRKIVNLVHVKSLLNRLQRIVKGFPTLFLRGYSVSEFNNQVVFEVLIKLCFLPSHDDVLGRKQIVSNWLPTIRVI